MGSVKFENVIEILQRYDVDISGEQAQLILDFMIKFARILLSQNDET